MDVRDDTTTGNSGLDQGIELLVTSNGKLQMSWGNSLHFEILGSVTSKLENLSGKVLKNGSAVDCGCGTDSVVGADFTLQESMNSSNWELNSKI